MSTTSSGVHISPISGRRVRYLHVDPEIQFMNDRADAQSVQSAPAGMMHSPLGRVRRRSDSAPVPQDDSSEASAPTAFYYPDVEEDLYMEFQTCPMNLEIRRSPPVYNEIHQLNPGPNPQHRFSSPPPEHRGNGDAPRELIENHLRPWRGPEREERTFHAMMGQGPPPEMNVSNRVRDPPTRTITDPPANNTRWTGYQYECSAIVQHQNEQLMDQIRRRESYIPTVVPQEVRTQQWVESQHDHRNNQAGRRNEMQTQRTHDVGRENGPENPAGNVFLPRQTTHAVNEQYERMAAVYPTDHIYHRGPLAPTNAPPQPSGAYAYQTLNNTLPTNTGRDYRYGKTHEPGVSVPGNSFPTGNFPPPTQGVATPYDHRNIHVNNPQTDTHGVFPGEPTPDSNASERGDRRYNNRRHTNSQRNFRFKPRDPKPFDSHKCDWYDYLPHFEAVADWNKWTDEQKAQQMIMSLDGDAMKMLGQMTPEVKRDYYKIVAEMNRCYDPRERSTAYKIEFRGRVRHRNENIMAYAQDLRRLVNKAYPDMPMMSLDAFVLDQFIMGLGSMEIRRHVQFGHPADIDRAISLAIEYEAFEAASANDRFKKPKGEVCMVKPSSDDDDDEDDDNEEGAACAINGGSGNYNNKVCTHCKKTNHTVENCFRLRKEQGRSDFRNRRDYNGYNRDKVNEQQNQGNSNLLS